MCFKKLSVPTLDVERLVNNDEASVTLEKMFQATGIFVRIIHRCFIKRVSGSDKVYQERKKQKDVFGALNMRSRD
jgi:hypothetical protein